MMRGSQEALMDRHVYQTVARRHTYRMVALGLGVTMMLVVAWLVKSVGLNAITVTVLFAALVVHLCACWWFDKPASPDEFKAMLQDYDCDPTPEKLDAILGATKLSADQISERLNAYRAAQERDRYP